MTTLSAVRGVKARRPSPPAGDQQTNTERPSRDADACERCPPELTSGYGSRCGSPAIAATSDPADSPCVGCGPRGRPAVLPPHPVPRLGADVSSPAHDATILRREGGSTVEIWELFAREHIRDTLARYNWAGDGARLHDLADPAGGAVLDSHGSEPLRGRSEIVAFLGGVTGNIAVSAGVKPIVRHNVANVLFNEVTRDEAHVSCYFTVVTHIGLDHFGRYRDILFTFV